MSELWKVHSDAFVNDPENLLRQGTVYQLANGYMGYRGTLDEFGAEEKVGITLAGLYDQVGDAWREPVNAPNGGFTRISLDDTEISARATAIQSHRQILHMDRAVLERETVFECSAKTLRIQSRRFLSADCPNLGVIEYRFTADQAARVALRTGIDFNVWDMNGPHLENRMPSREGEVLVVEAITHEAGRRLAVAEAVDLGFGDVTWETRDNRILRVIHLEAKAGVTYTLRKYFVVCTEMDRATGSPRDAAIRWVREATTLGYDTCMERHATIWNRRWEACDVIVDGDEVAQRALRYSLFQLLMVAPVRGSGNSIPARALSSQAYKGAVFWDTEMFMFPFFLHTAPDTAAELLRYRIRSLDGARRKARSEGAGYRGAFYAWESQETGDDACTYFNVGDPVTGRNLRTHFRDKQVHISGDIAIAFWEHFKVTGDDSLLLEGGAEVILECARFYYSYAYFKKEKNRYEILDVIGPDEYHERVNNNAFTNQVAQATFEIAGAVVRHLRESHPNALSALLSTLDIADELPLFEEAARLLYVPQPDRETGVIEQFDAYFKLQDVPVEELKARKLHPNEYLGAGQGLAVPTQVIKQADVVMMLNLFRDRYPTDLKRANWEYYEPRTEHGSSLSACAYAMVAAEFGDLEFAYRYFLKTAQIDLEAAYKMHVGTIFMGGSHPAANGGAWMTAVFGFGGLHATAEQVILDPRLYPGWTRLEFPLAHRGGRFRVRLTPETIAVTAHSDNQRPCRFVLAGIATECAPGQSVHCDIPAREVRST